MVPVLKSSDHTIDCACVNCGAILLVHAEDAQVIGATRLRGRFFLNKVSKFGLTEYNGDWKSQFLVEHVFARQTPRSKGGSTNEAKKISYRTTHEP